MTPEGRVKAAVRRRLKAAGVYWHCPVQNGMGNPSLDFICCMWGWYVAIETKAPGKKPTERQCKTIKSIEASMGTVLVVDGTDDYGELNDIIFFARTNPRRQAGDSTDGNPGVADPVPEQPPSFGF